MTLNAIPRNRKELDLALSAALSHEKEALLERMGPAYMLGLRVWYFGGPSAKDHDPREIPLPKIREFVRHYTSVAA